MSGFEIVIYAVIALVLIFVVNFLLTKTKPKEFNQGDDQLVCKFEGIELDISEFNILHMLEESKYVIVLDEENENHQKIISTTGTKSFLFTRKELVLKELEYQTIYIFEKTYSNTK